ncbi:MAG: glycosyltransferase family 39 protein [Chloroflexi bacterium]|nr:glycosyltransferase family 39 protein [Chloroflexota bacterium]
MQHASRIQSGRLTSLRASVLTPELWPALLLLAVYAVAFVQFAAQLVSFPFDLDQGEGYDAWSGWLINLGQLPYTSNASFPYYSSNYPPLWSYLVSIPMAWLGPGLTGARIVSTLSALATAAVLGAAAYRSTHRHVAGLLAGGFFLASPYVFHTTPLARVNSLELLGAVVALSLLDAQLTRRRILLAGLVLAAALFTKPTAIDVVVAAAASVTLRQPRSGASLLAAVGAVGAVGLGALMLFTHGAFWLNVVAGNANPFDANQLAAYASNFSVLHCVLLALAIWQCAAMLLKRQWSPWALYVITAGVSALGVAKWGAGESYFLGAIAAMCVLAAIWIGRFLDSAPSLQLRLGIGAALLMQALLLSHAALSSVVPWLPDRGPQSAFLGRAPSLDDVAAGQLIASEVRGLRGPALSEDPSFAVVAGKPLVGNATHLRNLYESGLWDPTPMVNDLRDHRYAIVILDAELYPEPVLAAIGQFYFLDRSVQVNGATYRLFLPGAQ